MNYKINDNKIEFKVNCDIYKKESVMQVTYMFIDNYYTYLDYENTDSRYIKVVLEPKKGIKVDLEESAGKFLNELLNQSLRTSIVEKTKSVRELVLARALFTSYLDESQQTDLEEDTQEEYSINSIAKDWFDAQSGE